MPQEHHVPLAGHGERLEQVHPAAGAVDQHDVEVTAGNGLGLRDVLHQGDGAELERETGLRLELRQLTLDPLPLLLRGILGLDAAPVAPARRLAPLGNLVGERRLHDQRAALERPALGGPGAGGGGRGRPPGAEHRAAGGDAADAGQEASPVRGEGTDQGGFDGRPRVLRAVAAGERGMVAAHGARSIRRQRARRQCVSAIRTAGRWSRPPCWRGGPAATPPAARRSPAAAAPPRTPPGRGR